MEQHLPVENGSLPHNGKIIGALALTLVTPVATTSGLPLIIGGLATKALISGIGMLFWMTIACSAGIKVRY